MLHPTIFQHTAPTHQLALRSKTTGRLLAIGLCFAPTLAQAAPEDITLLTSVLAQHTDGPITDTDTRARLKKEWAAEALRSVDQLSKERRNPTWFASTNPMIRAEVERLVTQAADGSSWQPADILRITAMVASGQIAERAMARAAALPEPPQSTEEVQRSIASQIRSEPTRGPLFLDLASSTVQNDEGAYGHHNGILDPGEAATLSLVFKNDSKERIYSTSLYVTAASECLYVAPKGEIALPEIAAGETATANLQVFASRDCAVNGTFLRLRAHDSSQFPSGVEYNLGFQMVGAISATLANTKLDGDDYGFSEPTNTSRLAPDSRVELSTGIETRGANFGSALQTIHVPTPLQATHTTGLVNFHGSAAASYAAPFDDADIVVPDKSRLANGLLPYAYARKWTEPEHAELFVAIDSVLLAMVAQAAEDSKTNAKGGRKPTPKAKSKASAPPSPPAPPRTTTASMSDAQRAELTALLAAHVKVVPVVTPGGAPAADARPLLTVDGFSLAVDKPDELAEALTTLLPSNSKTTAPDQTLGQSAPHYQFRHYLSLPVEWDPSSFQATCALSGKSSIASGNDIRIKGTLENVPSTAKMTLTDSTLGELLPVQNARDFATEMKPAVAGQHTVQLTVTVGTTTICEASHPYSVKDEPAPKPVTKAPKPEAQAPRLFSVELGGAARGGKATSFAGLSVGGKFRGVAEFETNKQYMRFAGGLRATWVVGPTDHFEISAQVSGGEYLVIGQSFVEAKQMVAYHSWLGPFVAVTEGKMLNSKTPLYLGVTGGLGFYFPPKN